MSQLTAEIKSFSQYIFKDARNFQIFYLSLFLVYGLSFLGWDVDIWRYVFLILSCVAMQILWDTRTKRGFSGVRSALITALGLCLLLKVTSLPVAILAGVLAISSKFLIRRNGKHVFNPANFGIIACVLLTSAWVSPGQWGTETVQVYFFLAAALLVLFKVGRIDTSLAFLISFGGLHFIRTVYYLGWESDHFVHFLSNGTLLLFTFFMITDPVTTPNHPKARVLWACMIGVVSFLLSSWLQLHTAPIWALIAMSPLTPVFDNIWKGERFSWVPAKSSLNSQLYFKTHKKF